MGRYDRYGDVLSPARREACDTTCESYFDDRRTAFDRYSAREGIRCDCNLRSGARIPGNGRSRRTHGRFRRCGDGYSDPVALRREHAEAFRRGDALVRGGVNRLDAGVLYLNYIERLDACVGFEREAIGPDRPNLNRMLIDGPILEERYEAGGGICVPDDCRGICCGGDPQPVAGGYRVVPYSKKAISFIRRATFIPFYS